MWNVKLNKVHNNSLTFIGPERTTAYNWKIGEKKEVTDQPTILQPKKIGSLNYPSKIWNATVCFAVQQNNIVTKSVGSLSLSLFISLFYFISFHFMSFELNINSKIFSSIDRLIDMPPFIRFVHHLRVVHFTFGMFNWIKTFRLLICVRYWIQFKWKHVPLMESAVVIIVH